MGGHFLCIADHMYRMGVMSLIAGECGVDSNRWEGEGASTPYFRSEVSYFGQGQTDQ